MFNSAASLLYLILQFQGYLRLKNIPMFLHCLKCRQAFLDISLHFLILGYKLGGELQYVIKKVFRYDNDAF